MTRLVGTLLAAALALWSATAELKFGGSGDGADNEPVRQSNAVSPGPGQRFLAPLSRIVTAADATAEATRLGQRFIPHPADAVCLSGPVVDLDPAKALNDVMNGAAGPIGLFASADIGGATNIGGEHQWIFTLGDTLLGANDGLTMPAETSWAHNSFLIQDNNCFWVEWGGKSTGSVRSLIPDVGTSYYWPTDGYVHGNTLYQFVVQVQPTGGPGIFDFELIDTDLAVFDLGTWNIENPTVIEHGPWDAIDPVAVEVISNVETTDGTVVFGVTPHDNHDFYGMIRLTDPANPLAPWQAWNGAGWGPLAGMASVMAIAPGDHTGIRPFQYGQRWYGMAFSWTSVGIEYRVMVADSMTGPYTELLRRPVIPLPFAPVDSLQYWHTLEGGYQVGPGKVLMQWANNGGIAEGVWLRFLRPSFTTFDLDTMTAEPLGS